MTPDEAFDRLDLPSSSDASLIASAHERLSAVVEDRLSSAPTDGLKSRYRSELAELAEARRVALSHASPGDVLAAGGSGLSLTQAGDLPGVKPSYTAIAGSSLSGDGAAGSRIALVAGQVLADRYEIRRRIGAGGMGAVFAAYDRNRDKEIAIKVMLPGLLENRDAWSRFLNEAKLSSKLPARILRIAFCPVIIWMSSHFDQPFIPGAI